MNKLVVASVGVLSAAIAFTLPAFAADMVVKPSQMPARPAPAIQTSSWSGGQFGGNGGGSIGNNAFVDPGSIVCYVASCPETPFNFSGHPGSFAGGGFIGYRWQLGNVVVGIEGDATYQNSETSYSQSGIYLIPGGLRTDAFSGSIKQGTSGSVRLRYGWLVTPMTLIYATGGVAIGEVSGSFDYYGYTTTPTTVTGSASWSDTRVGYTVGGGVETDVSSLFGFPGLKARLEYRFTSYGSYSKDIPLNCTQTCTAIFAPSGTAHIEVSDVYNQTVMAGIGFDF